MRDHLPPSPEPSRFRFPIFILIFTTLLFVRCSLLLFAIAVSLFLPPRVAFIFPLRPHGSRARLYLLSPYLR